MIRILVYGFGPYRQFRDNVTEKVLRRLPKRPWLSKTVFPVAFRRAPFIRALRQFSPELIIGLGQCSRGRRLRIESRAVNRRRSNPGAKPRTIAPRAATKLATTLRLQLERGRLSSYAGDYVCNYSMYVLLDYTRRHRLPVRFGFVHIPWRYDPEKAARLLNDALTRLARAKPAGAVSAGQAQSRGRRRSDSRVGDTRPLLERQAKKQRR